ncbi:MAG: DUF434 domain-containing protein [Candidatus Methanomethylicia archaeon]|nr:DUF434 domain-containing protein [Candidatus Methanomethylicia archaeon]MCX8169286.1 DUF434 domain-containing protein [Candidatus Methanomethylicia archaeon]MDW7988931.1 DUF434 domain-containing protein [Nitrososphaerota archaeon]
MYVNLNIELLKEAVIDLRYLLSRGYNRKTAVDYITSRYRLNREERAIIYRSVYSERDSKKRLNKLVKPEDVIGKKLLIDGFNNIITIESALAGRILFVCDDGVIRDASYISKKFKFSQYTKKAIELIFGFLKQYRPFEILFLFDQQVSFSGEMASMIRELIIKEGLHGDAKTSKKNDIELLSMGEIIASSDSIIIEKADRVFDLAGYIIKSKFSESILDISSFKN